MVLAYASVAVSVAVAVAVFGNPQDSAGGSIALDGRAWAAGNGGRVARVGAAVVFDGVPVNAGLLRLFVQLVEIVANGMIPLHTTPADDVLARGLGFVLGFRGRMRQL